MKNSPSTRSGNHQHKSAERAIRSHVTIFKPNLKIMPHGHRMRCAPKKQPLLVLSTQECVKHYFILCKAMFDG